MKIKLSDVLYACCGFLFVGYLTHLSIVSDSREVNKKRWDTSPCGNLLVSGKFMFGYYTNQPLDANRMFDDGRHVWKMENIIFPNPTELSPRVEWVIVMERSPEACASWKAKTGIEFPQ